jgi:hypothetical protein
MKNATKISLLIVQEIVWILLALLIATAVVYPLYRVLDYVFLVDNFLIVFYVVMLFRWTLFFKEVPWLKSRWLHFFLLVVNLNLFVFVISRMQRFFDVFDSFFIDDLGKPKMDLSLSEGEKLMHYFYYEINISVVFVLVLIVMFIGRMIHNYWSKTKMRLVDDRLN